MEKNYEEKYWEFEKFYWWFVGRRDLFRRFIGRNKVKILDVGCSAGANMKSFMGFDIYGFDLSFDSIKQTRKNGIKNCVVGNALNFPYKNNYFDFVICSDMLEHVEDDSKVIFEIKRVLKKNGKALIAVPAFKFLWGKQDEINFHKRRYSSNEIKDKLRGFQIIRLSYWNFFMFLPIYILRKLKKGSDDLIKLPSFLNKLLIYLIKFENFLIHKRFKFPFGVSLFVVVERK